ncbi:MAG: cellulase family glycosylhydrolase [Phycisphaera sp.]|nr:cellulase family glycosylhydrolase [Phycisphaera sp.]
MFQSVSPICRPVGLALLCVTAACLSACERDTPEPRSESSGSPDSVASAPVAPPVEPPAPPDPATSIGVNLAGAEFGPADGKYGTTYIYPGAKSFDYFKSQGMTVIRLPFKWEHLQPKLNEAFDEAELARIDGVVELARQRDMRLLMDVHNYARYRGNVIGTDDVPNAAFADFWRRFAEHFKDEPAIFAYGLMNEPHGTGGRWPAAAQAAVDAIRAVDTTHTISVCGDGYAGAHSWQKFNADLDIHDPAGKLIYEAHQYFDHNNSGTYDKPFDTDGATYDVGVKRLRPFIDWLEARHARGFIGEFGAPGNDPRWLEVLDRFLAEMKAHDLGGTYWAAGPWWGRAPMSVEPVDGEERPSMRVLSWYAGHRARPADAAVDLSNLPPPPTPGSYRFGIANAPYTYKNDASAIRQSIVTENKHAVRKVAYKHVGNPAWVGVGVYYGKLDCSPFDAFELTVRADHPCRLDVSAYLVGGARCNATLQINADWQTLVVPFAELTGNDGKPFDPTTPLEKVSFQPDAGGSRDGNGLYLDLFRPIKQ